MANILHPLPNAHMEERFDTLLSRPGVRIERIVSQGQTTPPDAPYRQSHDEWVLLLTGQARLWMAGVGEVELASGDYQFIPADTVHRVTWTATECPTVWLAIHLEDPD